MYSMIIQIANDNRNAYWVNNAILKKTELKNLFWYRLMWP